jgi:DNA-directed RNA polymerase specialized sigma24 family protein
LRFYEDLTEAQTADILGCAVGTVKSLVSRGIDQLRGELQRSE